MWWLAATMLFIFLLSRVGKRLLDHPHHQDVLPKTTCDPVKVPLTRELDLHSVHPAEVASLVDAYVEAAWDAGFPSVKIIHGRGTGTLRALVRSRLVKNHRVLRFHDAAPPSHWGATIAHLHQTSIAPAFESE